MSQAAALEPTPFAPLKIALTGYRSNPFSGGQGVYLAYLSKALAALGHQVDVISGEPYPELDSSVNLVKLPGLNLFAEPNHLTALRPRHLTSATDLFEWWSMATGGFPEPYTFGRRLTQHLARSGVAYDVIHDNQSLASGLLDLQRAGVKVTATIHHPITFDRDIAIANANRWGDRLLIRRWHYFLRMQTQVAQRLKHIVTVSESSKRDISAAFGTDPAKLEVIKNGIDTDRFRPDPSAHPDPNQLITVASADQPLKGTQHLIPAFAELRKRHPKLHLVFIGRPKPGGRTERLIRAAGVGEAIRFEHGVSHARVGELYHRSSVAIVPSEYEGFGLPAGEAMASGVPVVSTDGGALPEVVGDAGVVVPAKDSAAIARATDELITNPERRAALARKGRARVVAEFSWGRAAAELTDHYRRVIQ